MGLEGEIIRWQHPSSAAQMEYIPTNAATISGLESETCTNTAKVTTASTAATACFIEVCNAVQIRPWTQNGCGSGLAFFHLNLS